MSESLNEAQALAESIREQHFTIATSNDFKIAQSNQPIYRHSQALFIAAIEHAYPELPAKVVYSLWCDCMESVSYCAKYLTDNPEEMERWSDI